MPRAISLVSVLLFLVSFSNISVGQTSVGGYITSNTTWSVAGSPYILSSSVNIRGGALTIESGAEVQVASYSITAGYSHAYNPVWGALIAEGVTFTGSGGYVSLAYGGGQSLSNCTFDNVRLSLGERASGTADGNVLTGQYLSVGQGWSVTGGSVTGSISNGVNNYGSISGLTIQDCSGDGVYGGGTISDCTILDNGTYGISVANRNVSISNCTISGHAYPYKLFGGTHTLTGNDISGNSIYELQMSGTLVLDTIWSESDYGLPIVIVGDIDIRGGALTIASGTTLDLNEYDITAGYSHAYDPVWGALIAEGVTFTGSGGYVSLAYGGGQSLSNCTFDNVRLSLGERASGTADGNVLTGQYLSVGQGWSVTGGSVTGSISNGVNNYGSISGLTIQDCSGDGVYGGGTISDCTILDNGTYGISVANRNVSISNCTISGHTYPYKLFGGTHTLTGNDISGNSIYELQMSGTLVLDTIWSESDYGLPIVIVGDIDIRGGALTIASGTTLDLNEYDITAGYSHAYDPVWGALIAEGVTFTGSGGYVSLAYGGGQSLSNCTFDNVRLSLGERASGTADGNVLTGQYLSVGQGWSVTGGSVTGSISNGVNNYGSISGLTIQDCSGDGVYGGGTISDCTILDNGTYGISVANRNVSISNCTISGHAYPYKLFGGTHTLTGNDISGNSIYELQMSGTLVLDTIWSESDYGLPIVIVGDIDIRGGALTIASGTTLDLHEYDITAGYSHAYDPVWGALIAEGVTFTGSGGYVSLAYGGGQSLSNCTFDNVRLSLGERASGTADGNVLTGQYLSVGQGWSVTGGSVTGSISNGVNNYGSISGLTVRACAESGVIGRGEIVDCVIADNGNAGIRLYTGTTTIAGCLVHNNACGIDVGYADTYVTIGGSDIVGNSDSGLINTTASQVVAENCYWGDYRGPTNPSNPNGHGDVIAGNIDYTPWSTTPNVGVMGVLTGTMFLDENGNGIQDDGETGCLGTITLDDRLSVTSSGSGAYRIETTSAGAGHRLYASCMLCASRLLEDISIPEDQETILDIALTAIDWNDLEFEELGGTTVGIPTINDDETLHRYIQVRDRATGSAVSGVMIGVSTVPGSGMWFIPADAEGVLDIPIHSSYLESTDQPTEFYITMIMFVQIPPEEQFSFLCAPGTSTQSVVFTDTFASKLGVGISAANIQTATQYGGSLELIDRDGSGVPQFLKLRREVQRGIHGGLGIGTIGFTSNRSGPTNVNGGVDFSMGFDGDVYKKRVNELGFNWPPSSQDEAILMYTAMMDGDFDQADTTLQQLFAVAAAGLIDWESVLDIAYLGDGVYLGARAGASASGTLGVFGENTEASLGAHIGVGEGGGVFVGGYLDDEAGSITAMVGMTADQQAAIGGGIGYGSGAATDSGRGVNKLRDEFLEGSLNQSDLETKAAYVVRSFAGREIEEIGFVKASESMTGQSGVDHTTRIYVSDPSVAELTANQGGPLIGLAGQLFETSCNASNLSCDQISQDIVTAGGHLFDIQSLPIYSSNDTRLYYEIEETSIDELLSGEISISLGISATFGGDRRRSTRRMVEDGFWYQGRKFTSTSYMADQELMGITYDDVLQTIIDSLPEEMKNDAFSTVSYAPSTKSKDRFDLADGASWVEVDPVAIPAGISLSAVYWSWCGGAADKRYVDDDRRQVLKAIREMAEASFGMSYGIGGFHQLEPEGTALLDTVSLKLVYPDSEVVGIDESELAVYYEDKINHRFVYVGGDVDIEANTVTAPITDLRMYTLAPRLPFGSIILSSSADEIPADGISLVTIQSDTLRNNDGSLVADGTQYTVTTTNGILIAPDTNPEIDGVQIVADNGLISFDLRSSDVPYVAIVGVSSLDGSAAGVDTVAFSDTGAPTAPTGLNLTAAGASSIEVSWSRNAEADIGGYRVYFDTDGSEPPYTGQAAYTSFPSPIDAGNDTTVVIMGLDASTPYFITVSAYDLSGNESPYCESVVSLVTSHQVDLGLPRHLALAQNYPNPFNPMTTIQYSLPRAGRVRLSVYDVRGRLVKTLVNGVVIAGRHEEVWQADDDSGRPVASGIYLYRLQTSYESRTMKMAVIR